MYFCVYSCKNGLSVRPHFAQGFGRRKIKAMAVHVWGLGLDIFGSLCLLKLFFSVSRIAESLITAECFILTVELNIACYECC